MKRIIGLTALLFVIAAVTAQQPQPTPTVDPNAPTLTLEEKIALTTDDIKMQDALEQAQKAFLKATQPIKDHQKAAMEAIEKDHPGWTLETGNGGWHFVKKPEVKPAEPAKAPEKK